MSFWQSIAPFASAIAILISAIIAFFVFWLQRQQKADEWYKTFRDAHTIFWDDPRMAEVRMWISNDEAYKKIEPILARRAQGQVLSEEYIVLEKIDCFCALLTRVSIYTRKQMNSEQKKLWHRSYYNHWLTEAHNRQAFGHYIRTHWKGLSELEP